MAYVAPHGTIALYKVPAPLNPAYTHTIYFSHEADQNSFFNSCEHITFTNQMYTRANGNTIRVHAYAENLRYYNYMSFCNETQYNSTTRRKVYYCFIINMEYINEQVTEITFQIDELQTWLFDISWNDCFIERQHSVTDNLGENLVPEPLKVTENIVCESSSYATLDTYYLVVLGISDLTETLQGWNSYMYGGLCSTVHYLVFRDTTNLDTFINRANVSNGLFNSLFGGQDKWCILAIYAVPSNFFTGRGESPQTVNSATCYKMNMLSTINTQSLTKPSVERLSTHGNDEDGTYTPKNNKMFSYPFSYVKVASPINEIDLKYELFFGEPTADFTIKTCCNPDPAILVSPDSYNGEENDMRYSLLVDGFPSLTLYQSTQAGEIIGRALKLTATTITGALTSSGDEASDDESKVGFMSNKNSAPMLSSGAPTVKLGNATTFAPQFAQSNSPNNIKFRLDFYRMGLKKEFAEQFDTYLSKYGYAQNKVDRPNIHARQNWTYIKTRDCAVTGYCPHVAIETINNAMDRGITWWDRNYARAGHAGDYMDFTNPTL